MKNLILILCLIFIVSNLFGQNTTDRFKAEESVINYMASKDKSYKPISFGELFDQTYPNEIQDKLKTKKHVVYSIIHSYNMVMYTLSPANSNQI